MIFAHISPPGHLQMSFDIHFYPPVTGELRSLISCPTVKSPRAMAYMSIFAKGYGSFLKLGCP